MSLNKTNERFLFSNTMIKIIIKEIVIKENKRKFYKIKRDESKRVIKFLYSIWVKENKMTIYARNEASIFLFLVVSLNSYFISFGPSKFKAHLKYGF